MNPSSSELHNLSEGELRTYVRDSYNKIAKEWDISRSDNKASFFLLKDKIPAGSNVLDLGCGNGRLYPYLRDNFQVTYKGIDNSQELIKIAKKRYPDADFTVGDGLNLPFEDESFDYVTSYAVLHHIPGSANHKKFMEEISRVLKPGGGALITVWNMFQPRYRKHLNRSVLRKVTDLLSPKPCDAFVPFGKDKVQRYVHAFTPEELSGLIQSPLEIEELIFTTKENKEKNWKHAYNLCLFVRKS